MKHLILVILAILTICELSAGQYVLGPPAEEDLPEPSDVCKGFKIVNGVGFNNHSEDCDKFYQCYYGTKKTDKIIAPRQCPFGQYYDHSVVTCRTASEVECENEKCKISSLGSHPKDTGNCRAYWKCNLLKSVGDCCPQGQRYKKFDRCVEDATCKDPCPGDSFHEGPCDSRPIFGKPEEFEQYVEGLGWYKMNCSSGQHYSAIECGCVHHKGYEKGAICKPEVYIPFNGDIKDYSGNNHNITIRNVKLTKEGYAYFDGKAFLALPDFANIPSTDLTIAIKFLESPPLGGLSGLISNAGRKTAPTILMLKSTKNVHYMVKLENGKSATFHLPIHKNNWNSVYMMQDGFHLEGKSNEIVNQIWAIGQVKKSAAPIFIGYARGFRQFKGFIDEFAIYRCRPKFV